jgi:hypothetical protein
MSRTRKQFIVVGSSKTLVRRQQYGDLWSAFKKHTAAAGITTVWGAYKRGIEFFESLTVKMRPKIVLVCAAEVKPHSELKIFRHGRRVRPAQTGKSRED